MTAIGSGENPSLPARFRRDSAGVAAVEFALILPVALLIMGLVVYGGQLFRVQRKVTLAATTVADLVAQGGNTGSASITSSELNQILSYPSLILFPNNPTGVQAVVSQLLVTANPSGPAIGTVVGSWPVGNPNARPIGQQLNVDPNIAAAFTGAANSYVILSEVQYPFQPYGFYMTVAPITLHDSIMMIPRTNAQITVN
jgi:Flp pilus assembly pilin Flp